MFNMTSTKKCRKCGGAGYIPSLARVDQGRCWACLPGAQKRTAEQIADDVAYAAEMGLGMTLAERVAARRARRELVA